MGDAKRKKEVSVILPAFNEEKTVDEVIERTLRAFKENAIDGEIIFVDDGSTDATPEKANRWSEGSADIRVITHLKNKGLTEALLTGFKASGGSVVVFLCTDMQSDPQEDIPKLVNEIRKGYDVVLGWRQKRRETKVLVSRVYRLFCSMLFGVDFHDMNWIKAFRSEVAKSFRLHSDWHRYLPILAHGEGYKISEIKTTYHPRKYGKSRYDFSRIHKGFLDLISVKFHLSFLNRPMLFFGSIGLALLALGLFIGLVLTVLFFAFGIQIRPALLLAVLLLLAGLQVLSVGFLGELIVHIDQRIKKLEDDLGR